MTSATPGDASQAPPATGSAYGGDVGPRPPRGAAARDDLAPLRFSFAIAGSQKAGTTTLSALLDEHPWIRKAPRKEMHYFDDESRDWERPDHSGFVVPRRTPRQVHTGDATPLYLWWPGALERMHAYNPDMLLIATFRDPIERLLSQWSMVVNRWPSVAPDWPDFIAGYRPAGLEDEITDPDPDRYRMLSGVVRGYYAAQLDRARTVFGADRVHVVEFRRLLAEHPAVLDEITDFLGVRRFREHPALPHGMAGKPGWGTPPTAADVEGLVGLYREDLTRFRATSGLDVAAWPTVRVLDGTLSVEDLAARLAAKVAGPRAAMPPQDDEAP